MAHTLSCASSVQWHDATPFFPTCLLHCNQTISFCGDVQVARIVPAWTHERPIAKRGVVAIVFEESQVVPVGRILEIDFTHEALR